MSMEEQFNSYTKITNLNKLSEAGKKTMKRCFYFGALGLKRELVKGSDFTELDDEMRAVLEGSKK